LNFQLFQFGFLNKTAASALERSPVAVAQALLRFGKRLVHPALLKTHARRHTHAPRALGRAEKKTAAPGITLRRLAP